MITMKDFKNPNRRDINYLKRMKFANIYIILACSLIVFAFTSFILVMLAVMPNLFMLILLVIVDFVCIKKIIFSIKEIPQINEELRRLR